MSKNSKLQDHDMKAYTFANFGMVKRLTQKVEALLVQDHEEDSEKSIENNNSIDLFEEDIYLHFY